MLPQQRQDQIVRALRTDGAGGVKVLAAKLGVSEATIRRDLEQLHEQGRLTRVYGGALAVDDGDEPFAEVSAVHAAEKDRIAARAAQLVGDGESVLLDIGTTALRLAQALHGRPITVVTSNLAVLEELQNDDAIELIVLGGFVRRSYRSLVGFLTEECLKHIHVDWLFLGTSGIRPDGRVMDSTMIEVPVKRAMIQAADRVVLLADATKFPGHGVAKVCEPSDLTMVVTEPSADETTRAHWTEAGVEVVLA
ncbi:DeoR/GlpR family DNA-binding transcription regulator [Kribbella sp. NBC_01245]|uniref:DeoR/GlpR family DNA-binding transcription regulator n=1 Tax=Kribbella sp. NBC_01245 TaxID=2903578 RepID=UPI002E29FFF0|nr:DeoR/GlpR family DNA-binding transcription regulator [Kribbella sp. NBC_01245]